MPTLRPLATALALSACTTVASATVLIDTFSDAATTSYTNSGLFESAAAQSGTMIGGARFDGLLCFFACDYNPPFHATLVVGNGALTVTPPPAGLATTRVLWGDVSPNSTVFPLAGLGLDLSGEGAFELKFTGISAPLLVQFVVVSAGGQSDYRPVLNNPGVVLQAGGAQTLMLPFSGFVGAGQFAAIKGLGVVLGGNNGFGTEAALANFSLDSVTAVATPIPEPATVAMWLAGLLGLGVMTAARRQPKLG